jgi:hypothetical protein
MTVQASYWSSHQLLQATNKNMGSSNELSNFSCLKRRNVSILLLLQTTREPSTPQRNSA